MGLGFRAVQRVVIDPVANSLAVRTHNPHQKCAPLIELNEKKTAHLIEARQRQINCANKSTNKIQEKTLEQVAVF